MGSIRACQRLSLAFGGLLVVALAVVSEQAAAGEPKLPADVPAAIRLFNCDFNWARWPPSESLPHGNVRPSLPEDWAEVDARAYFNWHREAAFAEMQKLSAAQVGQDRQQSTHP